MASERAEPFRFGDRVVPLPLLSPRLRLRRAGLADAEPLVELLKDPAIARGTLRVPFPYRREHAVTWFAISRRKFRAGTDLALLLERRTDGTVVGAAGLHGLSPSESTGTVGYWIGASFRRQGFAGEATERLVRCAVDDLGLHRVQASVFPFNRPSMGVLRKAGFRREGLLRGAHEKDGRWTDEVLFARLATDPPPKARRGSSVPGPRGA
jgi:ribosomal-protein-alanine N-acetyltransferase